MKKVLVSLFKFVLLPLRFLSTEDYIVFESSPFYSDNTKVIYEYLDKKGFLEDKKVFWILTDRDFDIYREKINFTDKGVEILIFDRSKLFRHIFSEIRIHYYLSKARYYIYSHENFNRFNPKSNQMFLNLSHGISLKNTVGIYRPHHAWSNLIVLSEFTKSLREQSYGGGKDKMLALGFPRNDFLLIKQSHILNEFGQNRFRKNVVWLPTFRRQKRTGRNDTNTQSKHDLPILKSRAQMEILNNYLQELDILLLIKPHPAQDLQYFQIESLSNISLIDDGSLLGNNIHLYELLAVSDALLTDYSSVYIDYLLTDRMIGFTTDDIEEYKENLGFMVRTPEKFMPGSHINSFDELLEFFKDVSVGNDIYKRDREEVRGMFHKYCDNQSTERVANYIINFEGRKND